MVTSANDEEVTTANESLLGGSSAISSAIVRLLFMFFVTWETLQNVPNSAISILFDFSRKLINLLATVSQSMIIREISILFPHSLNKIRNYLGIIGMTCKFITEEVFPWLQLHGFSFWNLRKDR